MTLHAQRAARSMSPAPVISFVVPVRNDAARLSRCLATIATSWYPRARIDVVVADNGSTDGSGDVARRSGARVLSLPGLRVSALRNRAAQAATGEILAFVDADHEIDPAWAASVVDALSQPGAGAAGALCHAPANGTWVQRMYDAFRERRAGLHDVEWLGSGNLAVWRGTFLALGGFDETLETCEDVDLCQRLRRAGHRVMSDSRLRSTHHGDPATLRALFLGELWRGRDNLRASLRGPITWRGLPSIAIPVIDLGLLAATVIGLTIAPDGGIALAGGAACGLGGLAGLRAGRMLKNLERPNVADAARAFAVASVYDLARALAPVSHVTHRARSLQAGEVKR